MTSTIEFTREKLEVREVVDLIRWPRIILLSVLAYEAAGCLLGGSFLIAKPDGRLMEMPVEIMHGAFKDFLVPGIMLFGLGLLNTGAFITIIRKKNYNWLLTRLALGGLCIWFVVEIIILQELHWLHYMWGFPVFLGWVAAIPLIALQNETVMTGKALLICGILSSFWYVAINIFVPVLYEGYNLASFTVSELSAIGAPTRILWVLLVLLYPLLFAAFGWGVLRSAKENRQLRVVGCLIIIYSIMNFYWPPMHQREVIGAGAGTLTDTLHIVWAIITLFFMMLLMGFGAAALGKRFRLYTMATGIVFSIFGILTFIDSPGIVKNQPTPLIGVWERINIAAFLLWVVVLAIALLRKKKFQASVNEF